MTKTKKLENTFTWSASRAGSFAYCKRQYWWNYYGSWGGWEFDAQPETREAYILKNLSNRWAWVGTVVHESIERILRRMLHDATSNEFAFQHEPVDVADEVAAVTDRMREDWRQSRSGEYRIQPKRFFGLAEHEYGDPVPRDEWRRLNARAKKALSDFLASDLFRAIEASDPTTWLPIEALDQFEFEGIGIWAVLDYAIAHEDGRVEIYDWKTGEANPDSYKTQLGTYAMYMQASRGTRPEQVTTHLVFLGDEMQVASVRVTEEDLRATRAEMRTSIAAMRNRLQDIASNTAVRDDFPMTEDRSKCEVCVYRRLCGRP